MSGEQSGPLESYDNEKHSSRLWRKMKEAPFVPIGIGGLIGAVGYGIWGYKNRGKMSTSVYVMQFRVISQGMVVGAITIGIGINIGIKLWEKYGSPASPEDKK